MIEYFSKNEIQSIISDIKEFKSKQRVLKYPLWIDDYLIIIPHKKKECIDISVKDGNGHLYLDRLCSINLDNNQLAKEITDIINDVYYKRY